MENFNIEAYLEGDLTEAEKNAFEQEMQQNQTFQEEVELHRSVLGALQGQGIREQVTAALNENANPNSPKKKSSNRWFLFLILPLALIAFWFFLPEDPVSTSAPTPTLSPKIETPTSIEIQETTAPTPEKKNSTAPKLKSSEKKSRPIAETKTPSPIPPTTPPINIRGKGDDNEAWNTLLDSVWVSQTPVLHHSKLRDIYIPIVMLLAEKDYTMAFVKLRMLERKMPKNDTVLILKGYCLTELREGQQALEYFDKVKNKSFSWQIAMDWYRALSYLVIGDTDNAGKLFIEMSKNPNHPFRRQSQNALKVLK